jgi:predicted RNA-binding Zn-ribbon protein involved in translation (DUF1610 family)
MTAEGGNLGATAYRGGALVETTTVIGIPDIVAVRLGCANCPTTITCPPDRLKFRTFQCPGCGEYLLRDNSEEQELLVKLAQVLRGFTKQAGGLPHGFRVRLEVAGEPTG